MSEPNNWRELLKLILEEPYERERLISRLGIQPLTLDRWLSGESIPQQHNLQHLLNALPMHRDQLYALLRQEEQLEEFSAITTEDVTREISAKFYIDILRTRATTMEHLRFWKLCDSILHEALVQLDPDQAGMAIMIVRCMIPQAQDHKVHTLRETFGRGTFPWPGNLESKGCFLGAESLAGHAVTTMQPASCEIRNQEDSVAPAHWVPNERSACAHPLLYSGHIAGCLLISSTQPQHFFPEARLALVQAYADLLTLAFDVDDFYDPQDIQLEMMPPYAIQQQYFAHFHERSAYALREAASKRQHVSGLEAEELIWQQLEVELIKLYLSEGGEQNTAHDV